MKQQMIKSSLCKSFVTALLFTAVAHTAVAQNAPLSIDDSAQPAVGEVSLVLGKAWLDTAKGRVAIAPGTEIHATDRVLTEANGHVHIRFVDQALVSVRPDSRLEIVQYEYNADQPQRSSIKLNLEEGITRSISGHGASAARDRFRLNTPIAAIGVRGTDFVVSATPSGVRALVNEGVIVMAPFSSDCTMDAFGPCVLNAVELTDSGLQVIEMDGSSTAPRLLPASVEREPGMMQEEVQVAISDAENNADDKTAGTGEYLENVTSGRFKEEANKVAAGLQPPRPPAPEIDFTPTMAVASSELTDRNLVWGRWGGVSEAGQRITVAGADAQRMRDVGSSYGGSYILYRDGNGRSRVQRELGAVSFELASAQVFLHTDSGVGAMVVNGGSLDIDFNSSQFATELNMNSKLTGKVDFNAAGSITEEGFFNANQPDLGQRLAGTVSLDGTEAGYMFNKQLEQGNLQGLTLWDKR